MQSLSKFGLKIEDKIKKSLGTLRTFFIDTISLLRAPGCVWSVALQGRVATWPELVGGKQTPPSHTGEQ